MGFFYAVLAYVLVSGVVLYAQVPRMMRQDPMFETPDEVNETAGVDAPDYSEQLNKSVRMDRSVPSPKYDLCNNTAEPCGFRMYDKNTRETIDTWVYCICRDGLVCTYEGLNLSQSYYYYLCKNSTREARMLELTKDPKEFVERRMGLKFNEEL